MLIILLADTKIAIPTLGHSLIDNIMSGVANAGQQFFLFKVSKNKDAGVSLKFNVTSGYIDIRECYGN
ncbi:MAG: hypothetical protein ABI168_00410 [Ginsengibacter sp.]